MNLYQYFLNILNDLITYIIIQRQATHNSVKIYHMNTQSYRYNSVRNKSASIWNLIVSKIKTDMVTESIIKIKKMIKTFFINSYQYQ